MKSRRLALPAVACPLAAIVVLVIASGASSANPTRAALSSTLSDTWSAPGADLANDRDAGGPINAATVGTLGVAWTDKINVDSTFGGYATTPVVSGDVVYTQDLESNVEAIDLQTGAVIWTAFFNSLDEGPNGVTLGDGKVFGATRTSAFALDAATGRELWSKKLTRVPAEGIDMAPAYHDGTVYVSTLSLNAGANLRYRGGGAGVLWALSAANGATKWKWRSVPRDLWSAAHTQLNGGGGLWAPPTIDGKGHLYVGTANPEPFPGTVRYPWGSSRPGPDLYTDSIVKLSARTGKLIWYYQLTPHDVFDWDLQNSPILTHAGGRNLVIDGGKAGILVAVDARSGKPVWKRPVGDHNGQGNWNLLAEHGDFAKLSIPDTVEPGPLGGIESALASNGGTVFAAVNNLVGNVSSTGITVSALSDTGDLVAVNEATGRVEWDTTLPSSPYGGVTLANNVVFTTTYDGRLSAFSSATGRVLWSSQLPSATNAPVAVIGDTVITAASLPNPNTLGEIVAFRLGASGTFAGRLRR